MPCSFFYFKWRVGFYYLPPISLTAQKNGGKPAKETPLTPAVCSRKRCPLKKGTKTLHRKIELPNTDRHRSGRWRFFVQIVCSVNFTGFDCSENLVLKRQKKKPRKSEAFLLRQFCSGKKPGSSEGSAKRSPGPMAFSLST